MELQEPARLLLFPGLVRPAPILGPNHDHHRRSPEEHRPVDRPHERAGRHPSPSLRRQVDGRGLGHGGDRPGPGDPGILHLREGHRSGQRPEREFGVCDDHRLVRLGHLLRVAPTDEGQRHFSGSHRGRPDLHPGRERLHESTVSRPHVGRIHHPT